MANRERFLIVNADDFGASDGVNRGILECHTRGVLTSASLMVDGRAATEAVAMSRDHPGISLGLHWDVVGEDERDFDASDLAAVRSEFDRQLGRFVDLTGRKPTHVDSHKHVHRDQELAALFEELVRPLGVPLRGCGPVRFVGGFYGQWEFGVTQLEYVSVAHFERLLREEVEPGWTEISCHPGYVTADYHSVYATERTVEISALTDPRLPAAMTMLGITLANYGDFARIAATGQ